MSRREQIIDVAQQLLEAGGPDAVTVRGIAAELGIKAPSLYKHVAGRAEVLTGLQRRALELQASAFSGMNVLAELAWAYRQWALRHPELYRLLTRYPLDRTALPPEVEAAPAAALLGVCQGDPDRARALWAMGHGLVDLELAGRFPPDADLDRAWALAIETFTLIALGDVIT